MLRRLVCFVIAVLFSAFLTVLGYCLTVALGSVGILKHGAFGVLMAAIIGMAFTPLVAAMAFLMFLPVGWAFATLAVWRSKPQPPPSPETN